MKAIIIGTSLSGKTTIIRYLRSHTKLDVSEIDEVLTRLNGGTYPSDDEYKINVLTPQVIKEVLDQDIIFFTNTNYFSLEDLELAKKRGYKIIQLDLDLTQLRERNVQRVKNEGYSDLGEYLEGMVQYQQEVRETGLVDKVIRTDQPVENIVNEINSVAEDTKGDLSELLILEFEPKFTEEVKSVIYETLRNLGITGSSGSTNHRDEDLDKIPDVYHNRGRFWIAIDREGKVIGTVAIRELNDKTAKLNRMFVLPDYQGSGVGQKLLNHALKFAKEQNYQEVILNTSIVMKRAHRFYEKNGFRLTSEDSEQLHYKLILDE